MRWSSLERAVVLDLDNRGRLVDPATNAPVADPEVRPFLETTLDVPEDVTDIFVWVHGWRTRPDKAAEAGARLFGDVERWHAAHRGRYPALRRLHGMVVIIRWPSWSPLWGYARIRNRAHAMTTEGFAAHALAQLLGYLDQRRDRGPGGVLTTPGGQYLHCVGHSFGGRFLAEAIAAAADPEPDLLGLLPARDAYPFAVDNFLVFQMAATPDAFQRRFAKLTDDAPLEGPACLTHSRFDWAVCLWHRLTERTPGIGCCGAARGESVAAVRLRRPDQAYHRDELREAVVNVDASWRFRRWWTVDGAHSDFLHDESLHLLLTLVDFARPEP